MIQFFCQSKATAPPNQPSPVHLAFPISKHFLIIISFQYQKQFSQQRKPIFSIGARLSLQVFPSLSFLFFSFLYNPNKKKSKRKKKKKTHIAYLSHFHHLLCTNNNLFFHAFPTTNFKIVYKSYTRKEKKNIKPRRNPDKFM